MYGSNVTMRALKNVSTGIDISVPNTQEVEAPLGGTSTEYEINVFTNLELYKSHIHSKDDVIHFSVVKAYKELEDFYDKVAKKFADLEIPAIPKGRAILKCSVEEKRTALDNFMQYISVQKEICDSSIFTQFIGINRHRQARSRSSFHESFSEVPLHNNSISNASSAAPSAFSKSNQVNNNNEISVNSMTESTKGSDDSHISELFPKMKVRKASKADVVNEEISEDKTEILSDNDFRGGDKGDIVNDSEVDFLNDSRKDPLSVIKSDDLLKPEEVERVSLSDDLDLFEEVKQIKSVEKKESKAPDFDRSPHHGLFDSFEDDNSGLFSPKPPKTKDIVNQNSCKSSETVQRISKNDAPIKEANSDPNEDFPDLFSFESDVSRKQKDTKDVLDSKYISDTTKLFGDEDDIKEEKKASGGLSLFEEQDLGTAITEEDELLFFVAKKDASSVVNPLLSPAVEDVSDEEIKESLDELVTLPEPSADLPKPEEVAAPKPEAVAPKPEAAAPKPEAAAPDHEASAPDPEVTAPVPKVAAPDPKVASPTKEGTRLPPKPVPKPRIKPLNSTSSTTEKPQVAPRNVFPSKPPKPVPPPKPKSKPTPPPKKFLNSAQKIPEATIPSQTANLAENQKSALDDLSNLDILQYIEQEEKSAHESSLFD